MALFNGATTATTLSPVAVDRGSVTQIGINDTVVGGGFTGYGIATCNFPLAHGFFLVVSHPSLIPGQALVLPPTRDAAVVESVGQ